MCPTVHPGLKTMQNSLGMEFVWVPAGTFYMGSPPWEPGRSDGETRHKVILTKGFYIQTTEVTQGQWQKVMGYNPSRFSQCGADCPAENMDYDEILAFIAKLNEMEGTDRYRLPTEAEWEYACRAGTETPFAYGECLTTEFANYDGGYPLEGCRKGVFRNRTLPVKSFPPNAWGLYDMHGNVFEACQDWYETYAIDRDISVKGEENEEILKMIREKAEKDSEGKILAKDPDQAPQVDPTGPETGQRKVYRGGAWSSDAKFCRSARRSRFDPSPGSYLRGFRLVADEVPGATGNQGE
ncbi:MAG: formylglycine-generating enzyme family protein [Deltaproteobacteria bacterium]|nr:formylglycine-generating enzyme family protein [Deltaproteobacteria bacterium]